MKDDLKLTGKLQIKLNNTVVQEVNNLVVTVGKNWVASRMANADTVMTHMAIGTGTTAAADGDTALVTEVDRNGLTNSGGTVSGNTITYDCTWPASDGTGAITEAGIFNAATAGTMLARTVFPVVNKGTSDTMTISWVVTLS